MAYQTKQQQAVLRCLQLRAEECLSAADLSEELRHGGLTVGLATVYRQLDKLTQQGLVHKVTTEEGALYQYCPQAGHPHDCFLLRCEGCGRMVHLDCQHLEEVCRHLSRVPCQSRSPSRCRPPPPAPGFPVRLECRSHCGRFSPVRRDSIWLRRGC